MGFRFTPMFWKMLETLSDQHIHSAFLSILNSVTSFSKQRDLGSDVGKVVSRMTEEKISSLRAAALEKHQQGGFTLPSFGEALNISQEKWILSVAITQMPHLCGSAIETPESLQLPPPYRSQLVRQMVDNAVVDFGIVDNKHLYGKAWSVYLYCKMISNKKLRHCFEMAAFKDGPLLTSPDVVFPLLTEGIPVLPTLCFIESTDSEIKKFIKSCDKILTSRLGEAELEAYLSKLPISPRVFLAI